MATILTVSASPASPSKTARTRSLVDGYLADAGHTVRSLDVRDLPPAALLHADTTHPAIAAAIELFAGADGVVVATPVYKASFSGLLKTLLDLLPQSGLANKVVLPLATGGTLAHVLILDYALRPVLTALGAPAVVQGHFLLDQTFTLDPDSGQATLTADSEVSLRRAVDRFERELAVRAPVAVAA
ncbi:NADPH-dependent FMN reductase [Catenulispora yoronensis]|uniref:NADPH-dependent FMN reductase n=1 Tax=Catenulispora yoronensis TaxID=450799 RepID=A0ABN2TJ97_9ACTN